ncbi:MAG TPA: hypothetical protein VGI10_14590 [Polyangiaceae bacterium]|jgi:hypothetical protein
MSLRRLRTVGLCVALIASGSLAARGAGAEQVDSATRAAARNLGVGGVQAYQAGDYATATNKLEAAYAVLHAPSLGLWSARALFKTGKWIEARERYLEVTRLSPKSGDEAVQRQAQADAQSEGDALAAKIPSIVVQLEGAEPAEVNVTVDGSLLGTSLIGQPRPVNPGAHKIAGVRGSEHVETDVSANEGEHPSTLLRFARAGVALAPQSPAPGAVGPSAPPRAHASMQRTLGWAAVGLGAAGVAAGAVTGALVFSKKSSLDCANDHCQYSDKDKVDGYNSLRTVSTVSFVAGGVFAALGVALVVTSRSHEPTVALAISPGSASLSGRF